MDIRGNIHPNKEESSISDTYKSSRTYWVSVFFRARIDELVQLLDKVIISKAGRHIPAAIFAASVFSTISLWNKEYQSITQNLSDQLDKQLVEAIYPIQWRIKAYEQILLWIHGLFDSSKTVTREEFKSYTESLRLEKNFPEIPGISISYKVSRENLEEHIKMVRSEWFLDYGKQFDLNQKYFAPVVYIEPFSWKNLNAFGYDNFSNQTRKAIMEWVQDQDEPALSHPVCLIQEKGGKMNSSFLMFHSLYGKNVSHIRDIERKRNLFGWSAIAFRFPDLISQVSNNQFSNIDLRIYDGKKEDENMLLFNSVTQEKSQPRFWIKKIKTLNISGRDWTFVVRSTGEFENSMHYQERLNNVIYWWGTAFLWAFLSYLIISTRRDSLDKIKKITELATHDALTNLPNRMGFLNGLKSMMAHANRNNKSVALMFIDLDKFKYVNDTYGHQVGDELLIEVASRMKKCVRTEDIIGRPGGDEFLMALSDVKNSDSASGVAVKIISSLAEPFDIQWHEIYIGSSIGISMYPDDADNIGNLQMYADMAMYSVKQHGRNGYHFYSPGMKKSSEEDQMIITALHHAIERGEFSMVYQPIMDIRSGQIESMESLLRWKHPELGNISPTKFIPIAETNAETIISIGKWTIRTVCEQIALWEKSGITVPKIAINLSARQFLSKTLVDDILSILRETGITPHQIGLEITEWTLFKDIDSAVAIIANLSELGFEISIDDFGTGYSSLSYLRRFKVLKLKIDRSFVIDIHTESWEQMLGGIVALAHKIGMRVIAEWVEDFSQALILRELGCDYIQGYYFGRPENAEMILPKLVRSRAFAAINFIDTQIYD